MSEFTKLLDYLSRPEIEAQIKEWEQKYPVLTDRPYEAEEIRDLLDLHSAYTAIGEIESAAVLFDELKPIIYNFHTAGTEVESALEFLVNWNFIAMKYISETKDEFICLPIYRELLDAFNAAPPQFRIWEVKTKLQLVHHFRFWIANGGQFDLIPEEEREFFKYIHDQYLDELQAEVEKMRSGDEVENVAEAEKTLYKFFLLSRKPNEAIRWMKAAMEDLPKTKDFHPADLGDLNLELGKVFFQYKKFPAAQKYFFEAFGIYEELGEEFEMFMTQAESWLDECRKMV